MFRGTERSAEIALRTEGVVIGRPEIRSRSLKQTQVDLATFRSNQFDRGAGGLKEAMWLVVSLFLFRLCPFSLSALKCGVLRGFGARIGKNVVIKPGVKITFPWRLKVGDSVWLGEECWLLNLASIEIESNVCVSQRAFLCTGSHNFGLSSFDLIVKPIVVEEGSWICAGAWVGPGVKLGALAILTAGSVATKDLEPLGIYQGNPAAKVKERVISPAQRGV